MVEAVRDYGIFLLDQHGYIVSWNEGAERIKGYKAEEIIGKHFSIFYPREVVERGWPDYELEVAQKVGRFEDEGWRLRKDGSRFWANVIITTLRGEDGAVIGFTKVTRDLTEKREAEDALQLSRKLLEQTNAELAKKNRDLQDFVHMASHDLQEPLRKINTFAALLEQEMHERAGEEGRMYIDRIRTSAQRMSALIYELLTYSRVAARAQPFRQVDLNRIVEEVMGDLQVRLDETEGRIEREDLPTIEADPTQMRQLFQNLLDNALKYHQPGVPPVVHIAPGQPPVFTDDLGREVCEITVADNGIGFEDKYGARIFAPFYRLHTRSSYEGTGLGLAICNRIIERHGGSIRASSRPGDGALFTIRLPVRQTNANVEATPGGEEA